MALRAPYVVRCPQAPDMEKITNIQFIFFYMRRIFSNILIFDYMNDFGRILFFSNLAENLIEEHIFSQKEFMRQESKIFRLAAS